MHANAPRRGALHAWHGMRMVMTHDGSLPVPAAAGRPGPRARACSASEAIMHGIRRNIVTRACTVGPDRDHAYELARSRDLDHHYGARMQTLSVKRARAGAYFRFPPLPPLPPPPFCPSRYFHSSLTSLDTVSLFVMIFLTCTHVGVA